MQEDLISRQAALDALGKKPLAWVEGEYELGLQNQWECDVDAIKGLPSATDTNVGGNLIDRQTVIELVGDLVKGILSDSATMSMKMSPDYLLENLYKPIRQIPSAQPEQRWIPTSVKPPKPFEFVLIQDRCGCYELNTYIPPRIRPQKYPNGYWGEVDGVDYDYFDVDKWCSIPE